MTISVPAQKLREMLTAVLPHAGADNTLIVLEAVRFEVRDGTLFLIATDRYTIAVARCPVLGAKAAPVADAAMSLWLRDAHEMQAMLERAHGGAVLVFGDNQLTLDAGDGITAGWVTNSGDAFPDWRILMRAMLAGEPAQMGDNLGINPVHLAKFAVSLDEADSRIYCQDSLSVRVVRSRHDTGSPYRDAGAAAHPSLIFARGDWFLGALTPIRRDEDSPAATSPWGEWEAVTAAAEKVPADA